MTRNRYEADHAAIFAEMRAKAADRVDILTEEVGGFIGFYGEDWGVEPLAAALEVEFADLDLEPWIALGRTRRDTPVHGTHGPAYRRPLGLDSL